MSSAIVAASTSRIAMSRLSREARQVLSQLSDTTDCPPVQVSVDTIPDFTEDPHTLSSSYLSNSSYSFASTVSSNGLYYNAPVVLKYLTSRWKSLMNTLIRIGEESVKHSKDELKSIELIICDNTRYLFAETHHAFEKNTSDEMDKMIETSEDITKCIIEYRMKQKHIAKCEAILNSLKQTKSLYKTHLNVNQLMHNEDGHHIIELPTLESLCPTLFVSEFPESSDYIDDRKVFNGRAPNLSWGTTSYTSLRHSQDPFESSHTWELLRTFKTKLPAMWLTFDEYNGTVYSSLSQPTTNITRFRVMALLCAFDNISTALFRNKLQYYEWVIRIGNEISEIAGPPPMPPSIEPVSTQVVNAEQIKVTADMVSDDFMDPVLYEQFKDGDIVYKMKCCRQIIGKGTINGILRSGRTPKCPMCRGQLIV